MQQRELKRKKARKDTLTQPFTVPVTRELFTFSKILKKRGYALNEMIRDYLWIIVEMGFTQGVISREELEKYELELLQMK